MFGGAVWWCAGCGANASLQPDSGGDSGAWTGGDAAAEVDGGRSVPDAISNDGFIPLTDGRTARAHLVPIPACVNDMDERMAPIPAGNGEIRCVRVGAAETAATGYASEAGLAGPFGYVDPSAGPGGVGTRAQPFRTITDALQSTPAFATLLLSAGAPHAAATDTRIERNVTIIGGGSGAMGSVIRPTGTGVVFSVTGASGRLTIRGVRVDATGSMSLEAVRVDAGAHVDLEDVMFVGGQTALHAAMGGSAALSRVTIDDATGDAVRLDAGGDAVIQNLLARRPGSHGINANGGRVSVSEARIHGAANGAIVLQGTAPVGEDRVEFVAALRNANVGLGVNGDGRRVLVRLSTFAGTASRVGSLDGFGVYLGGGAAARIDPERTAVGEREHGTQVIGNARGGMLVSGTRTTVSANGMLIASNDGPGAFVQGDVGAVAFREDMFRDNDLVGLGIVGGFSQVSLQCNGFHDTQLTDRLIGAANVHAGDGFWAASPMPVSIATPMLNNSFARNQRFGAFTFDVMAVIDRSDFSGNGFPSGAYGMGSIDLAASNVADNRMQPPDPGMLPNGMERFGEPRL